MEIFLIVLVYALVFGTLTARSSHRRDPITSNALAHLFHWFSAMALVSALPAVLLIVLFGDGFRVAFPIAFGLVGFSLFSLFLFAILEQKHL